MIEMKAFLNEDDTEVALEFPNNVLTLTAAQLEEFTEVLIDVRMRMKPPLDLGEKASTLN